MKSEISVIGWNSSKVLVFNNFFFKKYLILQQNSGIPAVYLRNTKISQLKSEQCMKLEKLVIHTGRFLQKCNTHTHNYFSTFSETRNGKRKNSCQKGYSSSLLKAFRQEYLAQLSCTPAEEAPISSGKVPPHNQILFYTFVVNLKHQ